MTRLAEMERLDGGKGFTLRSIRDEIGGILNEVRTAAPRLKWFSRWILETDEMRSLDAQLGRINQALESSK